tara:strand:+ start:41 stop:388 length:348 start_codon:yes stop_codon:yes gene_type:complete
MKYVVTTQNLENYGADNDPPTQYWKYKSGSTWVIDADSPANAEAVVIKTQCSTQEHFKSYPIDSIPYEEWMANTEKLDESYREFLIGSLKQLSPDGTWINRPNHPTMIFKAPEGV